MPEIRQQDIADKLGLSVSTISLALRNSSQVSVEKRALIIETAQQMGYSRIQCEQPVQVKRLTYISPVAATDAFYGKVLSSAEAACRQRKIAMQYSRLEEPDAWMMDYYRDSDGLLLVGTVDPKMVLRLKALDRPLVLVDNNLPQLGIDRVVTENFGGVYNIITRLYQWGHRKIMFIRGPNGTPSFDERRRGYRAAMEDLNLETREIFCQSMEGHLVDCLLNDLFNSNKSKPDITALVAFNDGAAIEAHHTLHTLGIRMPEDIALVGFDDLEMDRLLRPSLTTCHVEREMMGKLGVERLLERINAPTEPTVTIVLDTTLVVRQSAIPPEAK
ncbi:MAG: LacI family DNA-binding transcriptional regulator [Anaerolineales bacterium]